MQLSTALAAARAAAAAIANVGDPQAFQKGGAGPATVADLAGQLAASLVLHEVCGHDTRLVAEEGWDEVQRHGAGALIDPVIAAVQSAGIACSAAQCERTLRAGADPGGLGSFWAIDPLDGTKGYLRGGQFAIAIALIVHGQPAVGVVAAPRLSQQGAGMGEGVLFGAVRSQGAWQVSLDSMHTPFDVGNAAAHIPIRCSPWKEGAPIRLASSVETAHSATDEVEHALAQIAPVDPVRIDSQAKYGLVARGSADAYIRRSPTATYVEHIWDHAAGALVAQEAGCTVTDLRGKPLDFRHGRGLSSNEGIVCATPALHAQALRALQPAFR